MSPTTLVPAAFRDEYSLESAVEVRPPRADFHLLVSPRLAAIYGSGRFESHTVDVVGAVAARCRLFLDIGAHVGFYSLLVAGRQPRVEVVALEPTPETYELLLANVEGNGCRGRIDARRVAASSARGRDHIYRALASDNCGFHRHPLAGPIGRIEVETTTVDALLAGREVEPLLVKIDTDGHELAILDGMRRTLDRCADATLVVELNPKMQAAAGRSADELLQRLTNEGFEAFFLDDAAGCSRRWSSSRDWRSMMDPAGYVNLYCRRREQALSVCILSHSSGLTGADRTLLEVVGREVGGEGGVVTVVLPRPGPLRERLATEGAGVLECAYDWWCDAVEQPPEVAQERLEGSAGRVLSELVPVVAEIDPDVLVSHTLAVPWGSLVARALGKPHVWNVCEHGDRRGQGLRFFWPFDAVREHVGASSQLVFTPTRDVADHLFPEPPGAEVRILYRYPEVDAYGPVAGELFTRAGALRVGVFASVAPEKGQAIAVRAVAIAAGAGVDVELLLAGVGSGGGDTRIEELVARHRLADRVRYVPFLTAPHPAMRACDVVVVPSYAEGFSRSGVEAALLGRPVLFTSGILGEIIGPELRAQLALVPGDAEGLARRLVGLAVDPERREWLGAELRRQVGATLAAETAGNPFHRGLLQAMRRGERGPTPGDRLLLAGVRALDAERRRSVAAAAAAGERTAELEARLDGSLRALAEERVAREEECAGRSAAAERSAALATELAGLTRQLETATATAAWRGAVRYWRWLARLAPPGSRRRRLYLVLSRPVARWVSGGRPVAVRSRARS